MGEDMSGEWVNEAGEAALSKYRKESACHMAGLWPT